VLYFNLYLSPFDIWVASLFSLSDTGPNNPANLTTIDNSCTVPRIKGNPSLPQLPGGLRYVPFMNYHYTGAGEDAGPNSLDRTREGHFELIEMGEVVNREHNSLTMIVHGPTGIPTNCLQIQQAWLPVGSASAAVTYWSIDPLADMDPPGGGLFGSAAIIDALDGSMMNYDAEAIAAFSDIVQHTSPAVVEPTLANVHQAGTPGRVTANVFLDGAIVASHYPEAFAIDAVSALFAQQSLYNQFASLAASSTLSEWIVTLPTKYAYTDAAIVGNIASQPFTRVFPAASSASNDGFALADVRMSIFDREEGPVGSLCGGIPDPSCNPFSPPPPGPSGSAGPALRWATNVLSFNQPGAVTTGSTILGSRLAINVDANAINVADGWATLALYSPTATLPSLIDQHRMRPDLDGRRWQGLPAAGFWVNAFIDTEPPVIGISHAAISRLRAANGYEEAVEVETVFGSGFE
jgi:hypothetical protein